MILTFLIVCTGLMSAYEAIDPQQLTELRDAGHYEEFARLLGVEDVDLVRPSKSGERSEVIDMRTKPVSPLGDILLSKEQREEQARTYIIFDTFPSYKWRNCTICFYIVESDFTPEQVLAIRKAAADFNRISQFLKLIEYSPDLGCEDFVYIISGEGCWSYLGRQGGAQPLSLQENGCVHHRIIQHEFMHAAGCHHEQTRSDRDKYVVIHWDNIDKPWHPQYEMTRADQFSTPHPYDYMSVMHYSIRAPGSNKRAISVKQSGIDESRIGHAPRLSDDDVRKLNDAYRECDKV